MNDDILNDDLTDDYSDDGDDGFRRGDRRSNKYAEPQVLGKLGAQKPPVNEAQRGFALEIPVENSIEKAMKVLKRKLIKEGVFKELKMRRYYEKPSEKKKRKSKESIKKIRKEESRMKKSTQLSM